MDSLLRRTKQSPLAVGAYLEVLGLVAVPSLPCPPHILRR